MMMFRDCLKKARENAKLSQKELADLLGVPASMISRYESTDTEPRISFVQKVMEVLKISPNTFFNYEYPKPYEIEFAQLLQEYRQIHDLSCDVMSTILNIPTEEYLFYENGKKLPDLELADQILKLTFECDLYEMLDEFRHCMPQIYIILMDLNKTFKNRDISFDIYDNHIIFCYPALDIKVKFPISHFEEFKRIMDYAEGQSYYLLEETQKDLFALEFAERIIKYQKKQNKTPPEQSEQNAPK